MSLLDKTNLLITPNAVKAGKLYSVIPASGTGDFSFTRNSTGSRKNSAGNREVVAINTPIINYPVNGAAPELLLEPQRTNLLLNSAVLVTQSITTTSAAHALSFTGTGTVTLSGTFSGSLVGTGVNNVVSLNFTPTAGTLTVTISGSCTLGQIEAGFGATANIPTIGLAVTRVSPLNVVINTIATNNFIAANQGTIFLKFGLFPNQTSVQTTNLLNLSLSSSSTFVDRITVIAQGDVIRLVVAVNNASVVNFTNTGISANNSNVAVTYLNGVYKLFTNGVLRFTSSAVTQTAYTSMQLTNQNGGGIIEASRSYKSLLLYNTALTDAQAITLTT